MASAAELATVKGMGATNTSEPAPTRPSDSKTKQHGCDKGCAVFSAHKSTVSLNIQDTPVWFDAGVVGQLAFTATYNQRDVAQPGTKDYSNLGPQWTHNWLAYIEDDASNPAAAVKRVVAGGGYEVYDGYNASSQSYTPNQHDGSVLTRVRVSPAQYILTAPDGSATVFSVVKAGVPRRIFASTFIDPAGNAVRLSYDSQFRLTQVANSSGPGLVFKYENASHPYLITWVSAPGGRQANLTYDPTGRLVSLRDAAQLESHFTYDAPARPDFIKSMQTPYGESSFDYGESFGSRWLQMTSPSGETEYLKWIGPGNDSAGESAPVPHAGIGNNCSVPQISGWNAYMSSRNTYYWSALAYSVQPTQISSARIDHWLHSRYGGDVMSGVVESFKEPLERRVWFNYPGQCENAASGGNPYAYAAVASNSPAGVRALDQYSARGVVLDSDDRTRSDFRTRFDFRTFNPQGNITKTVDPLGRETVYIYADNGIDVTSVRQKAGDDSYVTVAAYTYNSQHRPLTYTDAAGRTTSFTYNGAGQVQTVKNPKGETISFEYDARGRQTRALNANGRTQWSLTYDDAGNVVSRANSQGLTLQFEYDGLNRLTRTTWPDGSTELRTYDKLDLSGVTNRRGITTTYQYDAVRNLTAITEPISGGASRVTRMAYYPGGYLKTLTDPNGNVTSWDRDIQGRVIKKTYADGRSESYTYDSAGRFITKTDAKGVKTTWSYADDDRITGISFPPAADLPAGTAEAKSVSFIWDQHFPRLASMKDGVGETRYGYGPPGALGALQLISDDGPWQSDIITQTYDELGRLSTRTLPNLPNASTSIYLYDTLGRVSIEAHPGLANSMSFSYLGETAAEQSRQLASGGFTCGRTYAPNTRDRRLTSIDCPVPTGANLLPQWSYEIDELDRVTAIKSGRHESYFGYDSANRLTSRLQALIDPATGQGPVGFNLFTLDAADNLLNVSRSNFGSGAPADTTASFSVNALNQAVSHTGTALQYDANGNLTEDGGARYTWDARDRLVAITSKATGAKTTIQYDGLDRWAVITDGGKEVRYRWCGQELCAALDTTGKAKAHYFGDRGMYVLLPSGQPQRVAFVTDHLSSVKQYHDTAGNWLLSLDHEAYGSINRADLSPAGVSLLNSGVVIPGWAGLYMHWPTGTYLATYRAYSPTLKRWLKRDPIGEDGGINLYSYVAGAPINYYDPLGENPAAAAGLLLAGYGLYQLHDSIKTASDSAGEAREAYAERERQIDNAIAGRKADDGAQRRAQEATKKLVRDLSKVAEHQPPGTLGNPRWASWIKQKR